MRTKIRELLAATDHVPLIGKTFTVKGWVKTVRDQKNFIFIEMNDGSIFSNLQVLIDATLPNFSKISGKLTTGTAISCTGTMVESPGEKQTIELKATEVTIIGEAHAEQYPLQKKRHSFEFLRTIAHLRPRTNTFGAVARIRNALAFATHKFFQEQGFLYFNAPIIAASDCEGAGQMFQVTTLDLKNPPKDATGNIDFTKDFFARPTYLTVSGQLNAEAYACALSDVYTFGPTFRAESSFTTRHLAEFWMVEPEMAFADLQDDMECAEKYIKYLISYVLQNCKEDMAFFNQFIEPGVIDRLQKVLNTPFERATYTLAVRILEKSGKSFQFPVEWGVDLQSEHERYLTEEYFGKPVILSDYPRKIKAFYMRDNDDGKTVAAMDILVPKIGEIVGGSQREDRLPILERKLEEFGLKKEAYWWYLELRKYGSVPHAGFGLGFERFVQFVTGLDNIRDTIPFPRYAGSAEF